MRRKYRSTDDSRCSGKERLFTSWVLVFRLNERETHNFYYADCSCIAHTQLPSWTVPAQSQILTNAFFKNHQKSQPLASGHDVIHTPVYFLSGFFIMTFVIVISSAHERKLYSMCAPAPALSWIAQSPTKPNDKT